MAAVEAAQRADPAGRLRLWAHGDHPSASALALSLGFGRSRVLWQMRRSLFAELPEPGAARRASACARSGPARTTQAWIELNRRAFADHPEQGRWDLRDLRLRMKEPWFDPEGFLLAERFSDSGCSASTGPRCTAPSARRRPDTTTTRSARSTCSEWIPTAHGLGLGRTLTIAGLRYLRARGLDQVMLYVDESNEAARALYSGLGFARWSTDVLFTRLLLT